MSCGSCYSAPAPLAAVGVVQVGVVNEMVTSPHAPLPPKWPPLSEPPPPPPGRNVGNSPTPSNPPSPPYSSSFTLNPPPPAAPGCPANPGPSPFVSIGADEPPPPPPPNPIDVLTQPFPPFAPLNAPVVGVQALASAPSPTTVVDTRPPPPAAAKIGAPVAVLLVLIQEVPPILPGRSPPPRLHQRSHNK